MAIGIGKFLNWFDYRYMKKRFLEREKFDLNVCCGNSPCPGVNTDIVLRAAPNFVLVKDVYHLPFRDKQFQNAVCSHVLEHVERPDLLFAELQRVAERVVVLVPPLWDIGCMFNVREHRWQFLTFWPYHANELPKRFLLLWSLAYQKLFGQRILG